MIQQLTLISRLVAPLQWYYLQRSRASEDNISDCGELEHYRYAGTRKLTVSTLDILIIVYLFRFLVTFHIIYICTVRWGIEPDHEGFFSSSLVQGPATGLIGSLLAEY
jgi:hypothetical protein